MRALETQLEASREQIGEAARLREILELRPVLPFPTMTAQVIAREGVPWFRNITIDKGLSDGVTLSAPVLGVGGVMGRVVEVGPRAAKVQLLLDRDCGVGVRIERTRTTGVVAGQVAFADSGTSELLMKYVPVLADAFRATPLDAMEWVVVAAVALAPAVLAELVRTTTGRAWVA